MKQRISISASLIGALIFIVLLGGMAFMQTLMKPAPQWGMVALGTLTLLFFFTKANKVASLFFGLLLGLLLYCNLFMVFFAVWGRFEPLGISAVISALLATPILLLLYFNRYPRIPVLERACTSAFLVVTLIVYFIYEVS